MYHCFRLRFQIFLNDLERKPKGFNFETSSYKIGSFTFSKLIFLSSQPFQDVAMISGKKCKFLLPNLKFEKLFKTILIGCIEQF